jgi:hypothetical protein
LWAANSSCVEEIWKSYKEIVFESIECFVPHKILRKILDPEYYNGEVKQPKVKGRRAYNTRKLEEHHQVGLSKQLLAAKQNAQVTFLRSVLHNKGKCWTEFCKYIKRHTGQNMPAVEDFNGRLLITGLIEKTNTLNSCYAFV